ncbi:hypothetical protein NEOLEDRAFT_702798 [Neolentinus lepideus HHB14362 ss-1]|uniref:Uncharacterized protein n=1 Tax=Neolentinus lepideus HHB14362 ss-1 TaxID=1314782 RepID=A0A165V4R3_9AGAM|nr:hypothetical protein NEOLEDRAFT_702798 [Neolentinus lepideus HHB14362 ss-1]
MISLSFFDGSIKRTPPASRSPISRVYLRVCFRTRLVIVQSPGRPMHNSDPQYVRDIHVVPPASRTRLFYRSGDLKRGGEVTWKWEYSMVSVHLITFGHVSEKVRWTALLVHCIRAQVPDDRRKIATSQASMHRAVDVTDVIPRGTESDHLAW